MLLKSYTKEIFNNECMLSAMSVQCFAHLDEDVGKALPYLNAFLGGPGRDGIAVEDHPAARSHQAQMPVHGVLIEAHQHIEPVTMAIHLLVADAHRQKDVPAPDDRLIGVVGVEMEAAADKQPREDITWCCDALAGRTANA